jgi:predicted O-methyltransferase YrrM
MDRVFQLLEPVYAARDEQTRDRSWRLPGHRFPVSVTEEEGALLQATIREHGLCSGFELATGFGMSSFYAGLAMKEMGGTLLSMDCYSEERADTPRADAGLPLPHRVSDGLAFALRGRGLLDLGDTVSYYVGVSPLHVAPLLDGRVLDYVFIDGQHAGISPLLDVMAVLPFVASGAVLAFHDAGGPSVDAAIDAAARWMGGRVERCATRHNLAFVIGER